MVLNGFDNITERFLKCPTVYVRLWVWRLPLKWSWPGTRFSFLDSGPENPWKYQPSALRSPNWKGFSQRHCPARWWSISCSPSACTAHAAQHTIWPKITMLQNPALLDLHNSNGTLVIDQWCIFGSLGRKCKRYCNVWSAPGTTKTTEATLSHMMQYASDCCVELEYVHGLHHWGVAGSRFQEDLPWRCPQKCLPVANSHVSSYCTTPSCVVVTLKWMAQLRFGMFLQRPLLRPPVTTLMKQNTVKNTLVASLVQAYFFDMFCAKKYQSPSAYLWICRTEVYHVKKFEQLCHSLKSKTAWQFRIILENVYTNNYKYVHFTYIYWLHYIYIYLYICKWKNESRTGILFVDVRGFAEYKGEKTQINQAKLHGSYSQNHAPHRFFQEPTKR